MLSSTISKSIMSKSVKGLAARCFSTNPLRVGDDFYLHTPIFRTDMPEEMSPAVPTKVNPSYDIRESPLDYEMTLFLPKNVSSDNITVDVERGAKAMRIHGDEADENGNYFSKRFCWGGILDVDRLEMDFHDGQLHVKAPKIHYLNGNSRFNQAA